MAAPKKYPDELRARAVRLYRESDPKPVIRQLGVRHEALRNWMRQDEADAGERHDRPTTDMSEENKRLRQERRTHARFRFEEHHGFAEALVGQDANDDITPRAATWSRLEDRA